MSGKELLKMANELIGISRARIEVGAKDLTDDLEKQTADLENEMNKTPYNEKEVQLRKWFVESGIISLRQKLSQICGLYKEEEDRRNEYFCLIQEGEKLKCSKANSAEYCKLYLLLCQMRSEVQKVNMEQSDLRQQVKAQINAVQEYDTGKV